MSRNVGKIIEIDNSGFQFSGDILVNGWTVITNAASAVLIIKDVNNCNVIELKTTTGLERNYNGPSFAVPQTLQHLKVDTWTNIERIIIYLA